MKAYWCRFGDTRGYLIGGERINAEDDEAATMKAREIFANSDFHLYEPWDGDRLVHVEERDDACACSTRALSA